MKKILAIMLMAALLLSSVPAMAAKEKKVDPGTDYTMDTKGAVVLQNVADRGISPQPGEIDINPIVEGESPTTGMPYDNNALYLPMLVQISNPEGSEKIDGKKVTSAGIGDRAPWGGQYADVVYEGILYRSGQTRITFLFNDSFAEGLPVSVGPVRSARIGHVLLREEWQGGIVYAGGPRAEENNIAAMFAELGASDKGVAFNLLDGKYQEVKNRVKGVKAPDNYNVNLLGIRALVPTTTVATPHPWLFTDVSPYTDGYEMAYNINLDWGHKRYISHFMYDEANNLYLRFSGNAPYMTFASADDRSEDNEEQLAFSNVIIQRVGYEYTNNSKIMPVMQSVGQGNADIFIGGRYIPGYWVRESIESPTVFFDDQGNEIQLTRGKTFIAHFPPESLLTYNN
ncbi:MAG: DUF3048 C-terminal domain-containing protein [Clostridia bacterium]|nr:DUF3048 C-terminal domain-containing protein [Clostridia bacterium]